MTASIERAALHVLCFAPLRPQTGDNSGAAYAERLWASCDALGFDTNHPRIDASASFPQVEDVGDMWFRVLAARGSSDEPDASAVVVAAHDALGVVIRLPGEDDWQELTKRWRATVGDDLTADVLGETHLYTGVFGGPQTALAADCGPVAFAHLSSVFDDPDLELTALVRPGVGVWEREGTGVRTLVVVAPASQPDVVDRWLEPTEKDLPQLGRYFLHASKLRYEVGVFQRSFEGVRKRERVVDAILEELLALDTRMGGAPRLAETERANEVLLRARRESTALLISVTRLRDLQRTVEIACQNLVEYRPAAATEVGDTSGSPFERDAELGRWLAKQIGNELGYLGSVRERAQEAQALTSFHVEKATESHGRMQNRLSVLQTSILGALLGAFTVIGAFGPDAKVTGDHRYPLLAFVGAVALSLPPIVVRWYERYSLFEIAGAAAVGASAAWFAVALPEGTVSPLVAVPAAVAGAIALAAGLVAVNERVSRARRA